MKTTMKFPAVVCDHQRRTAIAVAHEDSMVQFIPLSYENGLQLESLNMGDFARLYPTAMDDYPVERAAVLYVQYSHQIGASTAALDALGQFVKLSAKDIEMATKTPSAKTGKPAAAAKKATSAKPARTPKEPTEPKEPRAPRENASQMFRDLIVGQATGENKFSDDQIFARVQKRYGLDDNKRSYVSWYRGDCVRKGLIDKPEKAPKEEKEAPVKKAAAKKAPAKKSRKAVEVE